jgi:hypothetical protein
MYEQVKEHNFQANVMKQRRVQCNIFKCFENQSDIYHDTRTRYLMEQDPLLLQNQAGGMDAAASDGWDVLKKRWALQGQAQVVWLSILHVIACGPRDIISLVIPRIGDNKTLP